MCDKGSLAQGDEGLGAGFYNEGLMVRFAQEAEGRMEEFSQQNLANMAWAFGKLTHHAPPLLDAIGYKATAVVQVGSGPSPLPHHSSLCPSPLLSFSLLTPVVEMTKDEPGFVVDIRLDHC